MEKWLFIHRQWFLITFSRTAGCWSIKYMYFLLWVPRFTVYCISNYTRERVCHSALWLAFGKHSLSKCPEHLFQKTVMGLIYRVAILVPACVHFGSIYVLNACWVSVAAEFSQIARRSLFGEDHLLLQGYWDSRLCKKAVPTRCLSQLTLRLLPFQHCVWWVFHQLCNSAGKCCNNN